MITGGTTLSRLHTLASTEFILCALLQGRTPTTKRPCTGNAESCVAAWYIKKNCGYMEPFAGLTQLLTAEPCAWKDIVKYVTLVRDNTHNVKPTRGLGQRLHVKAIAPGGLQRCAWLVACELARAYNGMLAPGGQDIALDSPDLPMKRLTKCTELRPELLPADVAGDLGWSATFPQGGTARYPTIMVGSLQRDGIRTLLIVRMHRFVCWLSCGPARAGNHEARHMCSNLACVRPSHLCWDSRSQIIRGRRVKRRRRR